MSLSQSQKPQGWLRRPRGHGRAAIRWRLAILIWRGQIAAQSTGTPMKFRTAPLFAAACALMFASSAALAQLAPIPKPSERKVGELEGWSDSKPAAKKDKADAKKPVSAKAGRSAKAEKPAVEKSQDGGIPLPSSGRTDPNDYAPVGFDKDGKLGTGMKF